MVSKEPSQMFICLDVVVLWHQIGSGVGRPRGSPKPKSSSDILCSWGFLAVNFYSTSVPFYTFQVGVLSVSCIVALLWRARLGVFPGQWPGQQPGYPSISTISVGSGHFSWTVCCRLRPKICLDFINGLGDGETLYFASPGHLLSDKFANLTWEWYLCILGWTS